MKRSKHLCKRNKNYDFRFSNRDIDDLEYMHLDRVELYVAMKEAFFNVSIEYFAKHYSSPVPPSHREEI